MATDVQLVVAGTRYGGWTTATIKRSIEALAANFRLELTEHDPTTDEPWRFDPSDACEIRLADEPLVNGYIDAVDGTLSANEHTLSLRGRDRTADLIDSSAQVEGGEWSGLNLAQLARKLVAPFDLTVSAEVDVGEPFGVFKIEPGESAFEALERAARQRGVLLLSDRGGDLVLSRPGNARATDPLIQGENVLEARAGASHEQRYAEYICLGSRPGSDTIQREQAAGVRGTARDRAAGGRNRKLVIIAEQATTPAAAKQRAEWEATTRAARSATLRVTVQGWRQSDDSLWRENRIVPVRIPKLRIDGDMLVSQVSYRLDNRGRRTELALMRPDAFNPKPVVENEGEEDLFGAVSGLSRKYDTNWGNG